MPRIQFSDVTPPEKRSIRNIPIPSGGKRTSPIVIRPEGKEPIAERIKNEEVISEIKEKIIENKNSGPYEYYYPKEKKEEPEQPKYSGFGGPIPATQGLAKNKQWIFIGIIAILIGIFIVGMMTVFASATVVITPKNQNFDVSMKITGTNAQKNGMVIYEVVKLSESKTASVPASGETAASIKASGKIVIYNDFSAASQRLITRTRFESPDGLIYRIAESVVVPGKKIVNGVDTPGSLEAQVFADEAGDKYNIDKSDFTIPGFKNDALRYQDIYARSLTEMTGGFVGQIKTMLPADKQAALQNIDTETQTDLQKELQSKVPEGLTLLPSGIVYESSDLPQKDNGSSVDIGKETTAYVIMLNTQDLSNIITNQYVSNLTDWSNIKPIIKDFSFLNIVSKSDNLEATGTIDLQIKGKVTVLADIDTAAIGQKLLGAPKKDAANLINEFPGISSITTIIRPIWKQSFPDSPSKIHVQTAETANNP